MDYPDLECQTFFSLLRRFPFMRRLVIDTFTQCYSHFEEFVLQPKKGLCATCSHRISDSVLFSCSYGDETCFSVAKNDDRCSQLGVGRNDRAYVSVSDKCVEAYGVHFESRDDVNFWFDANQKNKTCFVSALFSDEWEAWTQLASNACAGLRYSRCLTPSYLFPVECSRREHRFPARHPFFTGYKKDVLRLSASLHHPRLLAHCLCAKRLFRGFPCGTFRA
ncbi:hypothetical protein ABB37_01471 [Leptomonas pyrrhocoris]|uniref:Uncharacterized protein n=1 Tax=Leptomonas pyrrhocoris TaxID=157538 RepID=A0A0M9G8T5_LEPPY|nr:hypothetical protein ABB37_01471 [Leptomonas pyrrhocoris]KPA85053.1 hypothetical protein ABB37_01471 [Leptomonas pyrrhocoris]|eukprot:XP_015663492.1 hypothetical protein ABB37_01471 [Leptomonas pyrrhocoris]